jgi:hypothetical protein
VRSSGPFAGSVGSRVGFRIDEAELLQALDRRVLRS